MWLVSCRRQGMLTQGPAPDPKCKLNISSFLTLPHLLDCLICTMNSVSIVFLLWMMMEWNRWGVVDSYQGMCGVVLLSFGLSCPVSFFKWIEHDSCCVCFFVYYLFSLSQVPLSRCYWGMEIVVSVM